MIAPSTSPDPSRSPSPGSEGAASSHSSGSGSAITSAGRDAPGPEENAGRLAEATSRPIPQSPGADRSPVLPLVLYDGKCGLCNRSVQAILRRDRAGRFHFAALQSALGQRLLAKAGLSTRDFDTLVLIDATGTARLRSDAALGILAELPRWRWTRVGRFLPRVMRDAAYAWVARRRHRLFPPTSACALPRPEWRSRFLDRE